MSTDALPSPDAAPGEWSSWALATLSAYHEERSHDPLANGVRALAFVIARAMASGAASIETMRAAAKTLADDALGARAKRFAARHHGPDAAEKIIVEALDAAGFRSANDFKERIEATIAGIVFTAHPTFAMPRAMRMAIAEFADGGNDEDLRREISQLRHYPDESLTLFDEHDDTLKAIEHARAAIETLNKTVLLWGRRKFGPALSADLQPAPVSLATWVGYDLDGRKDIHWGQTFRLRLSEKALQLTHYADRLRAAASGLAALKETLNSIADELYAAAGFAQEQADAFAVDLEDPENVVSAANTLTRDDPRRLVSLRPYCNKIAKLIGDGDHGDVVATDALRLLVAEMKACGLGVARIHLRVNAAQVRSALRADLGLDETQAFLNRSILPTAAKAAAEAKIRRVNMASVFTEKKTARRQFMVCAQFKKHIDADTPIRFLIAECEAPATVMGAVFLAKLYGVDDLVDISPLFETPEAIERGGRFMERLLKEPEFESYIRGRGRIAIQLGYSDSGRFMGQLAAELAIERLHILLARALAVRKITDIEVILFNTHGESMGRGAFPGSFRDRFDHLVTPWTRSRYAKENLHLNAEASFQGGDGFLHFQSRDLGLSTVAQVFATALSEPKMPAEDRFYTDLNFSWDFFRAIKRWQTALFDNADYHVALSAFAPNMLVKTGSRRVRRQSADPGVTPSPRSLRAIPNNAILQQFCAPANIFGGIGVAAAREYERFQDWSAGSARADALLRFARHARKLTDVDIMRAYSSLYDAGFWRALGRDYCGGDPRPHAAIASRLSSQHIHTALSRLANHLDEDLQEFDCFTTVETDASEESAPAAHNVESGNAEALRALHAIRIALIMEALRLAASTPPFSSRHDVSFGALLDQALRLELHDLADLLAEIFPKARNEDASLSQLEEPADADEIDHGYPFVHAETIEPIRQIAEAIGEISVGIAHFYDAYG